MADIPQMSAGNETVEEAIIRKLRDEIGQLRTALKEIAETFVSDTEPDDRSLLGYYECAEIAKKALLTKNTD